MSRKDLAERMEMLGFPMLRADPGHAANETLADMTKEEDVRLWEGFPVALATAMEKGWFNYREAIRHLSAPAEKSKFNAFLALALAVWDAEQLKSPAAEELKKRLEPEEEYSRHRLYEALRNNEDFEFLGRTMSSERVRNVFERYHRRVQSDALEGNLDAFLSTKEQHDLRFALSQIFSPRQKELVLKKIRGEKFTKTEREYYSRTVKKKLAALANPDLHRLAQQVLR